jgi:subtilisin family serine protease
VYSVAGVDTQRNLVGYSTHGPGALDPQKPDIAAYTHWLGSEAFGKGRPDSGTSTACPVMAGVVAALRTRYPYEIGNPRRTPANLRQYLLGEAVQPAGVPAGWNPETGHGIVTCSNFDNAGATL